MIVKHNDTGKEYLVEGFYIHKSRKRDTFLCIDLETTERESFDMKEVSIIDGRFPPNFSMKRHVEYNGCTTFFFSIADEFRNDNFCEDYNNGKPYAVKKYNDFLDSLTDLHGLPRMKHPEIPEVEDEDDEASYHESKLNEEEKRLRRIKNEIESDLEYADK